MNRLAIIASALPLLLLGASLSRTFAAAPALTIQPQGNEVELSWTATSLTPTPPYQHYDFQLQQSSNLAAWSNAAPRISGPTLTGSTQVLRHRVALGNGAVFFRLVRWFDRPGADLRDVDFTGADLQGANLAGANLAGAQLAGTQLQGANIEGVDLGALPTAGVDFSGTVGTPIFEQVHGAAADLVSERLPRLSRYPGDEEFSTNNTVVPGKGIAKQLAVVGLKPDATVGQLNAVLANHQASIVSSVPKGTAVGIASMLVRFNTANPAELNELTKVLESAPGIAFAMPDIEILPDVVTDDFNSALGWEWDAPPTKAGGNWGLEHARVPQMWNYGESIIKAQRDSVPTLVIDFGFPTHTDLDIDVLNSGVTGKDPGHGVHVAGIIAASYGNDEGIDGVNPFTKLRAYTLPANSAWSEHDTVVSGLTLAPDTRVVNMSWGLTWTESGTKVLTPKELLDAWRIATNAGKLCYAVATNNLDRLFVCSAGNDFRGVPADINSGWTAAQIVFGATNILVVESLAPGGGKAAMSNVPGNIAAPGDDILSLALGDGYVVKSGTSMASPFVVGLAGFLWAAEPNLTVSQMMSVLRPFGPGSSVDAFESLLKINDFHPGTPILKGLLDIDDGTPDGATRVEVPTISHLGDRNFLRISGADFKVLDVDGNGGLGDGKVDMADFRMWRDWLLYGEEAVNLNYSLNGSDDNPKFDANQDGKREPEREHKVYPRGDFNGDGFMDRTNAHSFKGFLLTDLEVLMTSGLWEDPDVDAADLPDLIDSLDLIISAESLFLKEPGFPEATIHLIDSATGAKLDSMFNQPLRLTRAEPVKILTVPVGKTYFISSDPLQQPTSERLLMRSIDKLAFESIDRGGDFAVDLTAAEMTALFTTEDPEGFRVDSNPQSRAVVALLDKALVADPINPPQAYADDQANVYAWAKSFPDQDAPKEKQTLYTAQVKWQRAFSKLPNVADPKFHVKPIRLRLSDHDVATNELSALATILIERRVGPATNTEWRTVFYSSTKIVGRGDPGSANTFRVEEHSGVFPDPQPVFEDVVPLGRVGMMLEFPDYFGRVSLADITNGASFELRYTLKAEVLGPLNQYNPCDGVCLAEAYVGDPLDYGSGVSMRYGDFGGLFEFQGFVIGQGGDVIIPYSSGPDFYFVLFQTNDVAHTETPIALQMGVVGNGTFVVNNPPAGTTIEDFRLLAVPLARPVDVDGDGIDDLYEYNRPTILNALVSSDATLDSDDDGFTNLAEYQNGTDPLVKDQPPVQPSGLYPGLGAPSVIGGLLRVADLNGDEVNDLVYIGGTNGGLVVELGNPGGTFQLPLETPLTWSIGFATDMAVANLDSDDIPDLVITALVDNKAYLYRGTGEGRFQPMVDLVTGSKPRQVVALKLNADSLLDLAVLNENAKSINLFQNQGNGTFTPLPDLSLSNFGSSLGLAAADMNADGLTDLVASANSDAVVVFLSKGNGDFHPLVQHQVGIFPDYVAVGDIDGDGRPDIATASPSRSTLSVLYNNGNGTNFASAQILNLPVDPLGVIAKDLDGDGRASLIIGDRTPVTTVLHGQANRSLDSLTYLAINSGLLPALADFNGDGLLDLLNLGGGLQSVHHGLTNGTFDAGMVCLETNRDLSHMIEHTLPSGAPPRWVALDNQAETLQVLELSAPGSCQTLQTLNVGQYVQWLSLGDVSGDGIPDALVASYSSVFGTRTNGTNQVTIFRGDASGAFGNPSYLVLPEPPVQVHAAELNGDSRRDLVLLTREPSQLVVYLQDSNGAWLRQAGLPMFASTLLVSDLNSDGKDEVLVGRMGENTAIYSWNGTALAPAQTLAGTDSVTTWAYLDYDGDSDLDLLMSEFGASGSSILLSVGQNGTFGAPQTLLPGVGAGGFHVADVTGDGRRDLLLDDLDSTVTIYAAKAEGTFESPQVYILQRSDSSSFEAARLFLKDLTGDGRLDLIRTGGPGFRTLVHR